MAKKKPRVDIDEDMLPRRITRSPYATNGKREEWEPSALQWAIYEAVRRGGSYRQLAATFSDAGTPMTHQAVAWTCQRVDQFLAQYYMDKIREMRVRHTGQLEHIFCESMEAWLKSKEIGVTVETESVVKETEGEESESPDVKQKRKEVHQVGNPKFLSEARGALVDIRRIWAADKNPKVNEHESETDDDNRVGGMKREQLIEERINALKAALKSTRAANSAKTADQAG